MNQFIPEGSFDHKDLVTSGDQAHLRQAASILLERMVWRDTAEGPEFWAHVFNRLEDLSEGHLMLPNVSKPPAPFMWLGENAETDMETRS